MKTLVLIDGNNFAFRSAFTVQQLGFGGKPTNLIFGFLKNYISLANSYGEIKSVVCWDGGYEERLKLSNEAVEQGLIESSYKQNRRDAKQAQTEEEKLKLEDFFRQMDILQQMLDLTNLMQLRVKGVEGDDLIASYVKKYQGQYYIIIVSSDKDFYQLLGKDVVIFDAIKKQTFTEEYLLKTYGLEPHQWVHLAAFTGDGGDNIIGIKGLGEKTTLPLIQEFKTYQGVMDNIKKLVEPLREQYPDIAGVPYSGVRIAFDEKKFKKLPFKKVLLNALEKEKVVDLAYKLKKMKDDVPVTDLYDKTSDIASLEEAFREFGLKSLNSELKTFLNEVVDPSVVSRALDIVNGHKEKMDKIDKAIKLVTNEVKGRIFKCSSCNKDFMSKEVLVECPDCKGVVEEKPKAQQTEQLSLF